MHPWRVPCSPEKGFLKKRGMSARCTLHECWSDVGCGCGRVCASLCIVRECATAAGESERERETERGRERERETDSECVCDTHTHTHTRSPRTAWTYLALPKVHPVLLLRLDRVLLLHHHLLAAGPCSGTPPDILGPPFSPPRPILSHPMVSPLFSPTYLYPPDPRGPSCHIRWSLPSSAPPP